VLFRSGFARLGAIARERCRPFDLHRDGMIPGEGAAVLVLERLPDARARGAKIYAETLGYGVRGDAHHMTAGHPEGKGAAAAMRAALRDSGVEPDIVEYLKDPPDEATLRQIIKSLGIRPIDLVRKKEAEFEAMGLAEKADDDEAIIAAMVACPKLMERPIVVEGDKARIGRPPEGVLEIL